MKNRYRTKLYFVLHMVKRGYARLRNDDGNLQWYKTIVNNHFVNDDVKHRFFDMEFEVTK